MIERIFGAHQIEAFWNWKNFGLGFDFTNWSYKNQPAFTISITFLFGYASYSYCKGR